MKRRRVTLTLDPATTAYLDDAAARQTNGNVSALVDRIVQRARLAEAVRAEAAWYAAHPAEAEAAQDERDAAAADVA